MIEHGNVRVAEETIIAIDYDIDDGFEKFGIAEQEGVYKGSVRLYLKSGNVIRINSYDPKADADTWVSLTRLEKY